MTTTTNQDKPFVLALDKDDQLTYCSDLSTTLPLSPTSRSCKRPLDTTTTEELSPKRSLVDRSVDDAAIDNKFSVYICTPWNDRSLFHTLRDTFIAQGYDVYDWTSPEHSDAPIPIQASRIHAAIAEASRFVLYNTYPNTYHAASWTQWGIAFSYGVPITLVDPDVQTRSSCVTTNDQNELIVHGADDTLKPRLLTTLEQKVYAKFHFLLPHQVNNMYGYACLEDDFQWL